MSSNNPMFSTTEATVKEVIGDLKQTNHNNLKPKIKIRKSNESNKDMTLNKSSSYDKSSSSSINETEYIVKQ